ncbi:helix-turn-helix transcriptional regulator [Pseudomonas canadensis]|uniref:helix-turn-helix domain-containing protein n=1 Tax=Pseudomonas canadensis TaxID=915099 RepID=UPI0030CBD28F
MADAGLNETQLCKRSGVPQPTINPILLGESAGPRMPTIAKLAKAFKVSPE